MLIINLYKDHYSVFYYFRLPKEVEMPQFGNTTEGVIFNDDEYTNKKKLSSFLSVP